MRRGIDAPRGSGKWLSGMRTVQTRPQFELAAIVANGGGRGNCNQALSQRTPRFGRDPASANPIVTPPTHWMKVSSLANGRIVKLATLSEGGCGNAGACFTLSDQSTT